MASAPNHFFGINYIPDNPKMMEPPAYWLQRLYDFDSDLVVLPSRQRLFAYVLARRARHTPGLSMLGVLSNDSDTAMCARHGLLPICLVFRQGSGWSIDNLLRDLASRDTWRARDAHPSRSAAAVLDESDACERQAIKASIRDDMRQRAKAGWRSYQVRTRQRVAVGGDNPYGGVGSQRTQVPLVAQSGQYTHRGSVLMPR